jgi:nucleotide-binding universal stress UspA family protein
LEEIMLNSIFFALISEQAELNDAGFDYASQLAAKYEAHLRGVVAVQSFIAAPPLTVELAAAAILGEIDAEWLEKGRNLAERARQRVEGAAAGCQIDTLQGTSALLGQSIARCARLADLAVMTHPERRNYFGQNIAQDMLVEAGGPVLLVPPSWKRGAALNRIVIGWDGSAKAARAVRDAMPLLTKANEVEIVCVTGEGNSRYKIPGADAAASISRHCSSVSTTTLPINGSSVAQTLIGHASRLRSDVLVMGAYAHSRLRELVFGGATREVLSGSNLPVLLSF